MHSRGKLKSVQFYTGHIPLSLQYSALDCVCWVVSIGLVDWLVYHAPSFHCFDIVLFNMCGHNFKQGGQDDCKLYFVLSLHP